VAIPASLFAGAVVKNRNDVLRDAQDAITRTANIMHEHARKVFETEELVIGRVDDRVHNLSWDQIAAPETSEFLARLKLPLEQAVSIWVADADGTVQAGSQPWDRSVKIDRREFFTAQQQSDAGFHVSAAFRGRATLAGSFAVSRRRTTPDGRFDGTIHISLSPEYFARFFAQAAPDYPRHSALLLRADGEVLAREPADPVHTRIDQRSAIMRAISAHPDGGTLIGVSGRDGLQRMISFRRVEAYPVYVVLGIETSAVLAEWYGNVIAFGVVAAIAAVTLALMATQALRDARAKEHVARRLKSAFEAMGREVARREAAEQRLREAQKMEALGHLAGGIAHDFNNVLQGVIGAAGLIARRAADQAAVLRLTDMLVAAAERGTAITGRLTTLARRGSLRSEAIDSTALLGSMCEVLEHTLGGNVQVRAEAAGAPLVLADRSQLETVLVNLAVNARDAMASTGGTITLRAAGEVIGVAEVHPAGLPPGHYVRLSVTDDGAGMDAATLARAADPFFTTKPRGEGSGLGLSMANSFAGQSGGAMAISSTPGAGTTVNIWLPQPPHGGAARHERSTTEQAALPRRRGMLAVVDDEPYVREVMAAELMDLGHEVAEFSSAADALAWMATTPRLDLLVTDLAMPAMNGLMLVQAARATRPGLPALLVTGHQEDAHDATLREVRAGGPFAVLLKPVMRNELSNSVDALLRTPAANLHTAPGGSG
jgi:signal transduction histidine kinase/CheY-like chemotaxis protein